MPIYMDRHDLPGVTAMDVAKAHQEDIRIQENFGCRGLTYWFDEERGIAFCLIEAPDRNSVKKMHDKAHGLVPHQIIEVGDDLVNAFLGRIKDPDTSKLLADSDYPIIIETAFRTIMVTGLMDSALMISKYGRVKANELLRTHYDLMKKVLNRYDGRIVKQTGEGFIVSFHLASKSVLCALEIQKSFKNYSKTNPSAEMCIRIGLNAGSPVTENGEFFEQTVRLAKRLCYVAQKDQVVMSPNVRDLCKEGGLSSLSTNGTVKNLSPVDEQFLNSFMDVTETIWNETGFDVGNFGRQLGLSRSQLYRKTTSLTGYSPNEFIKEFRLKKALNLIEKQQGNVTEIAFQSGFSNPSYFSKCFQKRFGILPSNYAKTLA